MDTDGSAPVLSFPAILRNPGLTNRYAHLHGTSEKTIPKHRSATFTSSKRFRDQNEGKRWLRRKDNAHFVGNPHIVAATKKDYLLSTPHVQSTFPEPLPPFLPRSVKLSTAPNLPVTDPSSANAGRFSLSLKGMRRDLRRAGGRAQALVRDVETEMLQWLTIGGTILSPDEQGGGNAGLNGMGTPVGGTGTIFEVSRTPLQLVWRISDDAFARYVVHCCARYHEIVSFSKGAADERLTYLLRPNVTRPDRRALNTLETPPVTDIDYSSTPETEDGIESDFVSDHELEMEGDQDNWRGGLGAIAESPTPSVNGALSAGEEEAWSQVEDFSDADDFESGSDFGSASIEIIEPRLASLSLNAPFAGALAEEAGHEGTPDSNENFDPDRTITEAQSPLRNGDGFPRSREWTNALRSASPSRSPIRTRPRRRRHAKNRALRAHASDGKSFYDYLFI